MSERAQRYILWIVAALLVAGTGLALRYAKNYREQAASFVPGGGGPLLPGDVNLRFQAVRIVGRRNNQKAWTVRADRIDTTKTRNRVDFSGNIRAELIQTGKVRAQFAAPFATYDVQGQNLTAFGKLTCDVWGSTKSKAPFHLEAGQLWWGIGTETVRCGGKVHGTAPGTNVTGDDLTINLRTRDYTLRNLNARFTIEEGGEVPTALPGLPEGLNP